MTTTDAVRSRDSTTTEDRVKIDPDEIREFLDVLATQEPEHWGLIPKTVARYNKGEVPEQIVMLVKHPELALAVLHAAQARKRRLERLAEERGK